MADFSTLPSNRTKSILNLRFNSPFFLTIGIIVALVVENSMSALPIFTSGENAVVYRVFGFSAIVSFTIIAQLIFLKLLRNMAIDEGILYKSRIKFLRKVIYINQFVLITLLIICTFQVIFSNGYSNDLLLVSAWISFVSALFQLAFLIAHLMFWIRNYMDYTVLAYAATVSIIFMNLLFSLLYITYEINQGPDYITSSRKTLVSFTSSTSFYSQGYNITYVLSFVFVWVSSAILLRHYSRKIGRLKLWIILSVALLFFLGQFQYQIFEYLREFRINYPTTFNIIYTFVINASRPIGGILAAVALWSVATKITQTKVRNYLLLAAYGIMLLLSTTQAIRILSSPFPPFGISTITFMSIASYAMLVGFYYSAIYIAQDKKLRQAIYTSASKSDELKFLKNIGRSQLEGEIKKNVRLSLERLSGTLEEESGIKTDWEENIQGYIDMVLKERDKIKKS